MRYFRVAGLTLLTTVAAAMAGPAIAQVIWNSQPTTPAGAFANGMSNVISARGDYNLQTSQAALTATQAQSQEIQNRMQATNTYFQMRQANQAYTAQERGPRPTQEQLVQFAQIGRPQPLSPSELNMMSGKIAWPVALQTDQYAAQRQELENLFAKRSAAGGMSLDDINQARSTTDQMKDMLRDNIRDMPSSIYLSARKFLESLAYETIRPSA